MTRQEVISKLSEGITRIEFRKRDGLIREMSATLDDRIIPYAKTEVGIGFPPRKSDNPEPTSQAVWDTAVEGWRSFRWDSLLKVESIEIKEEPK